MRKLCCFLVLGLILSGCGLFSSGDDPDDYSKLFENVEEAEELKTNFYDAVEAKITEPNQKLLFESDFFMVSTADFSTGLYLAVIELYLLTPKLSQSDIEKSGDTYIITEENSQVKVKVDTQTNSTYLELSEDNKITMICESVKLGKDNFAYQLYLNSEETVIQMQLNGENGSLSVNTDVTSAPSTIFKAKSIPESFATTGTRVYLFEDGEYSFEGSFDIPSKAVTDFSVTSGLKQEYNQNESFSITDIVISVSYNDSSFEEINVNAAMVIGTVPDTATVGPKTLTIKYGDIQKNFVFTVIDPSQPQKTATNFEIVEGLNDTYYVNDEFDITNIRIKITYDDESVEIIYVTEAMMVGAIPTTGTAGSKSFKLSYKGHQQTFSFTVAEKVVTTVGKLNQSFTNFFQTLIVNAETGESFYVNLGNKLTGSDNSSLTIQFYQEFGEGIWGQWSNITLLSEGIKAIKANENGELGNYIYPNPEQNFGKTAYCHYNENSQTFSIGYWTGKELSKLYWFEQEISFDEETDSVKAEIKCGHDSFQLIRGYVEYNQISNGNYAANLYFPADENEDDGYYTNFEFRFTTTEGVISQNLWASTPATIYSVATDLSEYGKQGDKTMTVSNVDISFVDNLESQAEKFFNSFMGVEDENGDYEYEGSIEHLFLMRMTELTEESEDYYFDSDSFSLENSSLKYYLYLLVSYEGKVFNYKEFESVNITVKDDLTTIITQEDGSEIRYLFRYSTNKLSLQIIRDDGSDYLAELVKEKNKYYVQIAEGFEGYYYIYRAVYSDINNMNFAYLESNKLLSIYSNDLSGYATTGNMVFTLVKGILTYSER